MNALQSGSSVRTRPYELMEYELCKHFGWTPDEARSLEADDFDMYYWIMQLDAQAQRVKG